MVLGHSVPSPLSCGGPGSNPLELEVILSSLLGFRNKVLARKESGAGGLVSQRWETCTNRSGTVTAESRGSKSDSCPKPVRELPEKKGVSSSGGGRANKVMWGVA